ncbi:hypothetical protein EB73_34695 [Mycobacterium sp. SWH-M3]|nr:hypothetical protein EB73_34695 [Mycobacterium sp. SWH-M3]
MTGEPAVDEAIRQVFTDLVDVRDAHGSGQTPVSGTYFTDASKTASAIQTGIQDVSQAAGTHWHGESGDIYQAIAKRLTT